MDAISTGKKPTTTCRAPVFRGALPFAALLATALLATGCVSKQTGKQGVLLFSYAADDDVANFNKPIAVGAKLDVYVRQKGNNKQVTITAANTDKPTVLKVSHFEPHFFTLEAKGAGTTEITIKAQQDDGEIVEDAIDMRGAVPEVLTMRHYCTKDKNAYYLVGQTIYVPYEMKLKDGEPVIGYGYHPIEFEPAGAATLHAGGKHQQHLKLTMPKAAQTVIVKSTIDSTEMVLSVVDDGQIDGAKLEGVKTVFAGTKALVLVRPTIGGKPVCQANTGMTAKSTATDICAVKVLSSAQKGDDATSSWGWLEIEGKKLGKCSFEVNHLKANAKKGLASSFTIDVAKVVKP